MTPERWRQVDELLQETLERDPDDRDAFLDRACPDDATRQEVASLLAFHQQADGFLEIPAFEAAADLLCAGQAEQMLGQAVGPYRIEALLGAGGMGEVYLAEDTKLGRKVAIKLLPSYLEADELAKRRLVKEARAAAALDHPNICTIYEVLEDARPSFIAMQYVQGETLACRMRRTPLALRESLDIGVQIADALVEAHARGIIHRDIKPQNIMITPRAQAKVLDFGLAKMVHPPELQAQTQSQWSLPGLIVGTAPYMSPEQASGDGVDARSDLFSLGVVLYECVAGRAPFSGATTIEICTQILHCDPPPPSHYNPQVSPELDAVILKALAKDPASRYESAAAMLQVLRATRDSLQAERPGSAKTSGRNLRASVIRILTAPLNLWRRPRVLIPIMSVVLAVALIAFLRFPPWRFSTPHQPSPEALRWYQIGMMALRNGTYYDAASALGRATTRDDQYALAHAALAEAWVELGYVDKANEELLRASSLVRDLSPLPRLEGLYLQAITHVALREFTAAIKNYQEIVRAAPDPERAAAYVDLGRAYEKNNEVEKALESYLEASQLAPSDVAPFLRLGILYSARQQNLEAAEAAFQKAEEIYRTMGNYEGVAEVYYRRGLLFYDLDKPPEARAQLEKVLEITKTTDNQYQRIRALAVLSNVSAAEGRVAQAKQEANQAIESAETNNIGQQVTSGHIWLGNVYLRSGEYNEAETWYKQGLRLAQRDKDRLNEAWAWMSLGSLSTLRHNTEEGLRYLGRARLFYEMGGYRVWLSLTLTLIGRAYRDKGDYEATLRTYQDLLQQAEQANDLSQMALAQEEIGSVLAFQERYPEALSHYDESYRLNKSLKAQYNLGYSAMHRGSVLWQMGRYAEAQAALDEALAIAQSPDGMLNQLLASVHIITGRLELSRGDFLKSQTKCRQALALAGTQYKSTSIQATYTLGLAQARSGRPRDGSLLCGEAVEMAKTTGDPQLLAGALLAAAEISLENGQAQRACEIALQVQQSFARYKEQDSEWRAWLIAALAKQRLGEAVVAREYASNAAVRFSDLEQSWGPEAFSSYRSRPDVLHLRSQSDRILTLQP